MLDDSINIRGLKRFAVDNAGKVPIPKCSSPTGKKIAVIGGGPGGLSAAYFLSLMGHKVIIYEKRKKLGGMLRYGIPNYRLPIEHLENDISDILSTGIEVKNNVSIGTDISLFDIENSHDAVYIAIGAHIDKKLGIDGEESNGVISAVEMLRAIGEDNPPDFSDKTVVVIGGGNVAMDAARSAIRLGAKKVCNVYRRRKIDMTALPDEIDGAIAEGCEIITLKAPLRIESDENGNVTALFVKPQIIGEIDDSRRPHPRSSCQEIQKIPCDILIVAIGQGIESNHFAESGVPVKRGVIEAMSSSGVENSPGIFAGGDCVTGPATVIRAIAAGKVAAANIDTYLGYNHIISSDVEIPSARLDDRPLCGRVNTSERDADIRKNDFELIEYGMTCEEAHQESYRCLRCDHFGYGVFKGGRINKW